MRTLTTLCIFLITAPTVLVGEDDRERKKGDRYYLKPRLESQSSALGAAPPGVQNTNQSGALLRFVEGIDESARPFDVPPAKEELNDPFGKRLIPATDASDALPGDVKETIEFLDEPDVKGETLPVQTVFLLSEAGQITVAEAPNLKRRFRAVVVRENERANEVVFIAPSMRRDGTLEVMGWDDDKKLFNYYERAFADGTRPVWIWRGDSSHAWRSATRNASCFRCHRNGEPVMKELRAPWQNWHSQNGTIKPEAIPEDSPLKDDPLFAIDDNPFLKKAEEFENRVKRWMGKSNASQVSGFKNGQLSAKTVLEPFFRTTTANLTSSEEISTGTSENIPLPKSFFINMGLLDVMRPNLDLLVEVGPKLQVDFQFQLPRTEYDRILESLNFRLEDTGFSRNPGDTHFAFFTFEAPRTDIDLILQLVRRNVVSQRLAVTLLLIDLPNPVYSHVRAAIYDELPSSFAEGENGSDSLDDKLVAFFESLVGSDDANDLAKNGAAEFLKHWAFPENTWKREALKYANEYLNNVAAEFEAGRFDQYFRLLISRKDQFDRSDHHFLNESNLLFPRTEVLMGFDGKVGP